MPAHPSVLDFGPIYGTASGDSTLTYLPYPHRIASGGSTPLVVFSHGRGADVMQAIPAATSSDAGGVYRVIRELLRRGYIVVAYTFGSTTHYGSPAALAKMDAHLTAEAEPLGAAVTKVAWLAYSMGFTLASNWTRANPTKTAAIVGVAPLTDQDWWYGLGGAGATEMDAAYSTWGSAGGNNFDPIDHRSTLTGASIPMQLWTGSSDSVIPPGDVSGGVERYSLGYAGSDLHTVTGDHGTVWANVDPVAVADFIDAGVWS